MITPFTNLLQTLKVKKKTSPIFARYTTLPDFTYLTFPHAGEFTIVFQDKHSLSTHNSLVQYIHLELFNSEGEQLPFLRNHSSDTQPQNGWIAPLTFRIDSIGTYLLRIKCKSPKAALLDEDVLKIVRIFVPQPTINRDDYQLVITINHDKSRMPALKPSSEQIL